MFCLVVICWPDSKTFSLKSFFTVSLITTLGNESFNEQLKKRSWNLVKLLNHLKTRFSPTINYLKPLATALIRRRTQAGISKGKQTWAHARKCFSHLLSRDLFRLGAWGLNYQMFTIFVLLFCVITICSYNNLFWV